MGRRAKIDSIFCRALELEGAARREFLARAYGEAPELRAAVERLLADAEGETFLLATDGDPDTPFGQLVAAAVANPSGGTRGTVPDLLPGDRVGSFEITEELGRGGMAVVYRGERVEGGFRQQVALKILQRAVATEELLRRFEQERQILASLQHPHIARLLEGGVTEDGRPYFALEHISGRPVDRYCDEECLDLDARLHLFLRICEAVQHAHTQLVVHRDLKPANILVSDQGEIKLLDFGIAKALDPEPLWGSAAPATRTAVRLMTPEYASPEQIRGEPVSTAADIYQLGLILYELLTGRRPHSLEGMSLLEAERLLEHRQPTRPSTAVTRSTEGVEADALSRARRTTPERLRRRLKGDLDAVVLRALRLEPERRYPSVDRFAQDVERFLEGRPVIARRGTATYRGWKFLRRHRWAVAAGLVVLLTLVVYAATLTVQGQRIAQERDLAQAEAVKAEAVKNFLVELFEEVDPAAARGAEWSARDLLDRGAERLAQQSLQGQDLEGQPEIKAELLDTVGRVYRALGAYQEAEAALEESLTLRRARLGVSEDSGALALAETLHQAGLVDQRQSELAAAETRFTEALGILNGVEMGESPLAVTLRARRAAVIQEQGDYPRAEAELRAALDQQRHLLGRDHPQVGETLTRLARVIFFLGDLPQAEEVQREGAAALAAALGEDHPKVLEARMGVGFIRLYRGEAADAEAILEDTLADGRRVLGEDHPLIGSILVSLASVHQDQEEYDRAEILFREAIDLQRRVLGPDHGETLTAINDLGTMLVDKGDLEGAEPFLNQAFEGNLRRFGEDHPRVADNLYNLGTLYLRLRRYPEAEAAHRRCLAIRERVNDPGHLGIARSRATLGIIQLEAGKTGSAGDAESHLRRAIEAFRGLGEGEEGRLPRPLTALGWLLLDQGRAEEAEPVLREAVELRREHSPPDSRHRAEAELAYGRCLQALGRGQEAASLTEAVNLLREKLPPDDPLRRRL